MSVVAMRAHLSETDIRRLVKGETPEIRALAARKICQRVDTPELTREERDAANAIITMIADDAVALVRRALAVTLRRSEHLPRDIAKRLAADIESIAVPVISGSPVFDDADLIEIIRTQGAAKQCAVGARETVSAAVVTEIAAHACEQAVGVAAANDGAEFTKESFEAAFVRFCESKPVMDAFVARSSLPVEFTEKLISRVSAQAMDRLVRDHALPAQLAVELAEGTRERATVDLVDQAGVAVDMRRFVQQLQMNGRLTPSLIVRAVLRGHVAFFEQTVAEMAAIPHSKAWLLIHDSGPLGLKAVFDRTGLPPRIYPAIRAAIDTFHSLEMNDSREAREVFRRRLAERSLTRFQGLPEEDMEYILARLDEDRIEPQPAARMAG